jgi:3-dehydroquinate synthase
MEVPVFLNDRSYAIRIESGALDRMGEACRGAGLAGRAVMVTDSVVRPLYSARVEASLRTAGFAVHTLEVPAGEASKDWTRLVGLYEGARAAGLDRHGFVVALGGGVVGDLAGFFAASWLRGVDFVQVPTTLLAMVDSSVGGKTGINLPCGKNLVGAFHQPRLVWADPDTLRTLPPGEFTAGMAEVIKYGAIADAALLAELEACADAIRALEAAALEPIIARCCALKAEVVAEDEREGGRRAILNFGHTLGHAIEAWAGYGGVRHGEAVGIGMAFAARVSVSATGLPPEGAAAIDRALDRHGLPRRAPAGLTWARARAGMTVDKKTVGGRLKWVLLPRLGAALPGCEVEEAVLEEAWRYVGGE